MPSPQPTPNPSPGPNPAHTPENVIAATLIKNGFRKRAAVVGTSIVLAESGGDPRATNDNRPAGGKGIDRGWWQINSYWHPEVSDACAFSPTCSTKAALKISGFGTVWFQWSTYKSGAYREHLGAAEEAVEEVTSDDGGLLPDWLNIEKILEDADIPFLSDFLKSGPEDVDPLDAVKQLVDVFEFLTSGESWLRVFEFVAGVGCIGAAVYVVAKA